MVKLEATAGTNINHIRRSINAQSVQSSPGISSQAQENSLSHATILAASLGEHQSKLGFLQAYEQNISKLEISQKALQEPMEKTTFEKQLESMMDIVDNTIYAGEPLFSKGAKYGLELGTLEGIETDHDIQLLGENITQIRQNLSEIMHETTVALINTLSAIGTQTPYQTQSETQSAQLERIRKLLDTI